VELRTKASDARLELVVLGGVDERVDAAVDEDQRDAETVEPAGRVDRAADEAQKSVDLIGQPACDEAAADRECCE